MFPMRRSFLLTALLLTALALMVAACSPSAAGPDAPGAATTPGGGIITNTAVPAATAAPLETSTPEVMGTATSDASTALRTAVGTPSAMTTAVSTPMAMGTAASSASGTAMPDMTPSASGTAAPSGASAGTGVPGVTTVNQVTYTAVEYSFTGPDTLPAGWTEFTLDNQGQLSHDLQVFRLAEGKTLADVTAALSGEGMPDWIEAYGGVTAGAGESASFSVELTPGNFIIMSFGSAENAPPDAAQGMLNMITVTEASTGSTGTGTATLPVPDVTVNMVDFRFEITGTLQSGSQVLHVMNTGTEPHEFVAMRFKEGKTMADLRQVLEAEASGQEVPEVDLPVEFGGGITLSPGIEAFVEQSYTAGNYAFVCFIPSPANGGRPHLDLGMIEEVTVQ